MPKQRRRNESSEKRRFASKTGSWRTLVPKAKKAALTGPKTLGRVARNLFNNGKRGSKSKRLGDKLL